MPPAQLTPPQLTDLSQLLRQRYRDLSLAVERELHADGMPEIAVTTASDADWTAADVDADAVIARAERDSSELTEVAEALTRMEDGRYGICETCGKDIGYPRLLVHPAARRCLACQQTAEAKGDSSSGTSRRPR
jgi:DnaK suppressor protein